MSLDQPTMRQGNLCGSLCVLLHYFLPVAAHVTYFWGPRGVVTVQYPEYENGTSRVFFRSKSRYARQANCFVLGTINGVPRSKFGVFARTNIHAVEDSPRSTDDLPGTQHSQFREVAPEEHTQLSGLADTTMAARFLHMLNIEKVPKYQIPKVTFVVFSTSAPNFGRRKLDILKGWGADDDLLWIEHPYKALQLFPVLKILKKERPCTDWFLLITDDAFVSTTALQRLVKTLPFSRPVYAGSPLDCLDTQPQLAPLSLKFASLSSGILLNQRCISLIHDAIFDLSRNKFDQLFKVMLGDEPEHNDPLGSYPGPWCYSLLHNDNRLAKCLWHELGIALMPLDTFSRPALPCNHPHMVCEIGKCRHARNEDTGIVVYRNAHSGSRSCIAPACAGRHCQEKVASTLAKIALNIPTSTNYAARYFESVKCVQRTVERAGLVLPLPVAAYIRPVLSVKDDDERFRLLYREALNVVHEPLVSLVRVENSFVGAQFKFIAGLQDVWDRTDGGVGIRWVLSCDDDSAVNLPAIAHFLLGYDHTEPMCITDISDEKVIGGRTGALSIFSHEAVRKLNEQMKLLGGRWEDIFGQDPSFGNPDSTFFADIQLGIFAHRYGIPLVPIRGVQWMDYDLLPKGFPDAPILAQHLPSIGTLDKHHNDSAAFTSFAAKEFSRFCDIFVDQNQAFLFGTTT